MNARSAAIFGFVIAAVAIAGCTGQASSKPPQKHHPAAAAPVAQVPAAPTPSATTPSWYFLYGSTLQAITSDLADISNDHKYGNDAQMTSDCGTLGTDAKDLQGDPIPPTLTSSQQSTWEQMISDYVQGASDCVAGDYADAAPVLSAGNGDANEVTSDLSNG
jgi:hypothetical protein